MAEHAEIEVIPEELKSKPYWGVVSNFSVDCLYESLTYEQALELAKNDAKEWGRTAQVVLLVGKELKNG